MTLKKTILMLSLAALTAAGCGQRKAGQTQKAALPFPDVQVPAMLDEGADVAEYVALHCWDAFADPSKEVVSGDSLLLGSVRRSEVEQKFADWVAVLEMAGYDVAVKAVSRLYDKVYACEKKNDSADMLETFAALTEKYFYDPNSPYRNEDFYNPFAARLAKCEMLEPEKREKYARQAQMSALNRVGTKAADFRFADRYARMHTLHGIESELTLLFFSNPGCEACMNIINTLKGNPEIAGMVSNGILSVVNVYIDEDIAAWKSYMPIYPTEWYNGFDPDMEIRNSTLYDVRAIPSLYLLDKEKRVIMKDAPEQRVFAYLENTKHR